MQGGKEIIVMQRESMKTLKLILEKKINVENKEDSFQHKDSYGSKRSGVQYMNRKSIQIQMSSLLSKLLSAGQKGTMYNIPERMAQNKRSVLVKLKDEKDSISYPNRRKKKKVPYKVGGSRRHLWKNQQTSYEKPGHCFFYHCLAYDLVDVKQSLARPQYIRTFRFLSPLKVYDSMAAR